MKFDDQPESIAEDLGLAHALGAANLVQSQVLLRGQPHLKDVHPSVANTPVDGGEHLSAVVAVDGQFHVG